ncbi:MAG: MMPL family transporter, partial [Trebonia sp.]
MFEAWGRALFHRRHLALWITVAFVAFAVAWGTGVFSKLSASDTFTPPASQSQRESDLADQAFGRSEADVVVLYRSKTMTVSNPLYRRAVTGALAGLPHAGVARTTTYWSSGSADLVSTDRHATYAVLQLTGADDAARQQSYTAIRDDLGARQPGTRAIATTRALIADGITAEVGGSVPLETAINDQVTADIARAEGFSMPVLLLLLLVIFGSLAAAALPLAIGGIAILGSFTVLRALTLATPVSVYSVNITTILGLGLGLDYALFIVTRFREELRRQPTVEQAVARTVATAGRTVAVSGTTVAVALTSLTLFPETFLRSMGYGGVATVAVDVIAALTVLPALLAVLGHRVNAVSIRRKVAWPKQEDSGGWYWLANSVMRRPVVYATVIVIGLLALGTPFLRIQWGGTDARSLPAASTVRQVSQQLGSDFPVNSTAPIEVLLTRTASPAALTGYLRDIDAVPGVTKARLTGDKANSARIDIGYTPATVSPAARHIVARIRSITPPGGATALVGGTTAGLVDELSSLGATLPWMALLVCVSTFMLLFLAFGS